VRADADLDYTVAELVDGTRECSKRGFYLLNIQRFLFQLWPELLRRRGSYPHVLRPKDEDTHRQQRIYVHESVYDDFVPKFVDIVKTYKLGDPTKPDTNLGPVVSLASAERIRKQVEDASTSELVRQPQSS